jgi:hypothetical protein
MLDAVFTSLVESVRGFIAALTGRVVLAILSLGRWRGERGDEGLIYGPGGALSFKRNGQRVLTTLGLQFLGTFMKLVKPFDRAALVKKLRKLHEDIPVGESVVEKMRRDSRY